MKMIKKEVENQTYDTFRSLLRKGIGLRTQTQFANETGISRGNINRLLNQETIPAPSEKTILALAAHMNQVSAKELLESCGYEQPNIEDASVSVKKALDEHIKRFIGSIVDDIPSDCINDLTLPYADPEYKWDMIKTIDATDYISIRGEKISICSCGWNYGKEHGMTFIAFGFAETKDGKMVICDATTDYNTLAKIKDVPIPLGEMNHATSTYFGSGSVWAKTPEQYLLRLLFGSETGTYTVTIFGCGFYYTKTPEGFRDYVIDNAEYFCHGKKEQELFKRLCDTNEDPDEIFAHYHGWVDGLDAGTGCVIAEILKNKTGQQFMYMKKDEHKDEEDEDDSCIILPDEKNMYDDAPFNRDVLRATYEAAAALGIKKFGMTYHEDISNRNGTQEYNTDDFHYNFIEEEKAKNIIRDMAMIKDVYEKAKTLNRYLWKEENRHYKETEEYNNEFSRVLSKTGRIEVIFRNALENADDDYPTFQMKEIIEEEYEKYKDKL